MRHREKLERVVSVGVWFYEAVPVPGLRLVPLKIIMFGVSCYWRLFGIGR